MALQNRVFFVIICVLVSEGQSCKSWTKCCTTSCGVLFGKHNLQLYTMRKHNKTPSFIQYIYIKINKHIERYIKQIYMTRNNSQIR